MCAGLDVFKAFSAAANAWRPEIRVTYALQTNATLLNEDWCTWLKENDCLVGVSLDVLPDCHDAFRLDAAGKGTYRRVLDGVALTVLCNWTDRTVPCALSTGDGEELISNYPSHKPGFLRPYEARVLLKRA